MKRLLNLQNAYIERISIIENDNSTERWTSYSSKEESNISYEHRAQIF